MPNIYIGPGSVDNLTHILARINLKKIFLVTGKSSFSHSGAQSKLGTVFSNFDVIKFNDFSVNPQYSDVIKGVGIFSENNCDLIIAIGGGSVIDMGKSINAFQSGKFKSIESVKFGINEIANIKPLIAIPTTSGTGSECTHFSVCYDKGIKHSISHVSLKPKYIIVDSQLTYSLPAYIAACSGFDAFCQAIESYWSINSTVDSRKLSEKAMLLIRDNIESAVAYSSNSARDRMSLASYYAGQAINITKTTAPHAMSYYFTSRFNIPHGHAVALLLGSFFRQIDDDTKSRKINDPRGHAHIRRIMSNLQGFLNYNSQDQAFEQWKSLMKKCNLETDLTSFAVSKDKLSDIVDSINNSRLRNHPFIYTRRDLERVVENLF